ncbi:MAG: hypothetical protein ACKOE6_00270 [Flammeovirgaceae bacterium]
MIGGKKSSDRKCERGVALVFTFFALGALCFSCGSEGVRPSDDSYFPLQLGAYWIYDVEETNTLRVACTDNGETLTKYELKVEVTDSFPNTESEGGYSYVLTRSMRANANQSWQPFSTWTSKRLNSRVVNNEGNISYLKFVFPLYESQVWNGNLFNNEQQLNGKVEDEYKATQVGKPFSLTNGQSFQKTVTVVQNDEQKNILYRDSRQEVYAWNVGLVYKESYLLKYFANSQLPCYAQNRTQQGTIWKQTLKEVGRN